jgi:hypothetical protein
MRVDDTLAPTQCTRHSPARPACAWPTISASPAASASRTRTPSAVVASPACSRCCTRVAVLAECAQCLTMPPLRCRCAARWRVHRVPSQVPLRHHDHALRGHAAVRHVLPPPLASLLHRRHEDRHVRHAAALRVASRRPRLSSFVFARSAPDLALPARLRDAASRLHRASRAGTSSRAPC